MISVSVGQCVPFHQSKDPNEGRSGRHADEGGSGQLCGAVRRTDSLVLSVKPEAQAGQEQDPLLALVSPSREPCRLHTRPPGRAGAWDTRDLRRGLLSEAVQ